MSQRNITNGLRELMESGVIPKRTNTLYQIISTEYLNKHYEEFSEIARKSNDLSPFLEKQDKTFERWARMYKHNIERKFEKIWGN